MLESRKHGVKFRNYFEDDKYLFLLLSKLTANNYDTVSEKTLWNIWNLTYF